MAQIEFKADKVSYEINEEDNYYMIAFSDNGDEPEQYVIVQRAITLDKQDIALGMDSHYFESSDPNCAGYGICRSARIENGKVIFELEDGAIDHVKAIEIKFEGNQITDPKIFKDIFDKIFSAH